MKFNIATTKHFYSNSFMKSAPWFYAAFFLLCLTSCESPQPATNANPAKNSPYTHGNVQLTLKKGVTTQADVLETFGAPNIATIDASGQEVWTYEKHATVASGSETGSYGTIILFGGSANSSRSEQSSRTMTLIIKFDSDKKVSDFKSMTTSF